MLNRRQVTTALLAAPFLALAGLTAIPRRARAQEAGRARRLLIFSSPNGTIHRHWRPMGGENDFAFPVLPAVFGLDVAGVVAEVG